MEKPAYRVVSAAELDPIELDRFLRLCFSENKCDFLRDHGAWRHRGNQNRHAVVSDSGEIVGYFASIPTRVLVQGQERPALWWMDLYVLPQFRGQGIQRLTDAAARKMADLHFGFPNHLAAIIHAKHGWGVRSDYRVMMLPLEPSRIPHLRQIGGWRGYGSRTVAHIMRPAAWAYRHWLARGKNGSAQILSDPTAEILANVFHQQSLELITTCRDPDFIRWRYLDSPHRSQYTFFVGGFHQFPNLAIVTRTFVRQEARVTRILDIFGDFEDRRGLAELLRFVTREATTQGSVYVSALATHPGLMSTLRAHGFILHTSSRLRWWSGDPELMQIIGQGPCHWCLADSDNDSID
jgi:GNAT superfamily N-acetyltransferase